MAASSALPTLPLNLPTGFAHYGLAWGAPLRSQAHHLHVSPGTRGCKGLTLMALMYCFANLWHSSTFSPWRSISSSSAWESRVVSSQRAHHAPARLPPARPGPTYLLLPQLLLHGLAVGQWHGLDLLLPLLGVLQPGAQRVRALAVVTQLAAQLLELALPHIGLGQHGLPALQKQGDPLTPALHLHVPLAVSLLQPLAHLLRPPQLVPQGIEHRLLRLRLGPKLLLGQRRGCRFSPRPLPLAPASLGPHGRARACGGTFSAALVASSSGRVAGTAWASLSCCSWALSTSSAPCVLRITRLMVLSLRESRAQSGAGVQPTHLPHQ